MLRIEAFPDAVWPWSIETLHWAYLISGLLIVAHYGPLLRRAWLHTEATATAQSLLTWSVWTACRLVAFSYGVFVLHDAVFLTVVGADVTGRLAMAVLIVRARHLHRRHQALAPARATGPALDSALLPQGSREQQSRLVPVAADRPIGDVQRLGDLQVGHADEVAHLHDPHQSGIESRELLQRLVHLQDLDLAGRSPVDDLGVQRQVLGNAASALAGARPCKVDDDRAHGAGAVGEEVIAVAGQQASRGAELQIALVDQRRRVEQGLVRTAADAAAGQPVQFRVQRLEKIVERSAVAIARPLDQDGDVAHGVRTVARGAWAMGACFALAAAGCQPPPAARAPATMAAAPASPTAAHDALVSQLQRHGVAVFVHPFIDDSDPPRFTTVLRPLLCADHSTLSMNGRAIADDEPVPAGEFTLQWDMDMFCPFGVAGPLVSGRIEVVVVRDDTHGLDAIVRPATLHVLEPSLPHAERSAAATQAESGVVAPVRAAVAARPR